MEKPETVGKMGKWEKLELFATVEHANGPHGHAGLEIPEILALMGK